MVVVVEAARPPAEQLIHPNHRRFSLSPTLKGELEAMGDLSDPKNESIEGEPRAASAPAAEWP